MILHEKHGLVLVKPRCKFLLEKLVVHLEVHCLSCSPNLYSFLLLTKGHWYISWATYIHSTPFRYMSWKSTAKLSIRLCILPAGSSTKILLIIYFFVAKRVTWKSTHPLWLYNSAFGKIGKLMARKRTEAPQNKKKQKNRIQCRTKVFKVFVLSTVTGEGPWVRASFSVSKPFDRVSLNKTALTVAGQVAADIRQAAARTGLQQNVH